MFKVEVGKGPLMFMSYSRIMKEVTREAQVEEVKDSYYAILYDFGMPIGCGRMKIEDTLYIIDNIKIFKEFSTQGLIEDISTQLLKKAKSIGLEEKN
ncbi:hypothetical protein NRK67_06155 [Fusobacteria bacterium ZRK30]|nr:hypothetical protein NRK67_06155 [Fusobacteria bacterium ZRK30]